MRFVAAFALVGLGMILSYAIQRLALGAIRLFPLWHLFAIARVEATAKHERELYRQRNGDDA